MKLIALPDNHWAFEEISTHAEYEQLEDAITYSNSGDRVVAERMYRHMIDNNPHYIDAYHHLSLLFDRHDQSLEAYLCCREAVRIGLDAFPESFNWQKAILSWGEINNRPFMRAYHSLGLWHERRGDISSAIHIFLRLESLCPLDNLGVRYLLPRLWLKQGDYLSVVRHCKAYEEVSPTILYAYPLALALLGEEKKARVAFAVAEEALPLVAKELRKKRHPKPRSTTPGFVTIGSADEAYDYWKAYGHYWQGDDRVQRLLFPAS